MKMLYALLKKSRSYSGRRGDKVVLFSDGKLSISCEYGYKSVINVGSLTYNK